MIDPKLPFKKDVTTYHQKLKLRHPIWDLEFPTESISEMLKTRWNELGVRNLILIDDPLSKVPGYDPPRTVWSALNTARTGQDRRKYFLYKR